MDCCGPIWDGKGQSREIFEHIPTIKWCALSPKCHMIIHFPGLWEEKSKNHKKLNIIWKLVHCISKTFPTINERCRHRWSNLSPCSLVPSFWHLCHPFSYLCLSTSDAAEHAGTQETNGADWRNIDHTNGLLWALLGWGGTIQGNIPIYSNYKMVCPEHQMSHAHTFSNPRTFGRKSKNPKRLQHYLKIGPSQKHSETIKERHRHRWSTCLLALWPLLFGIFAILFRILAFEHATQLNMQEPKNLTAQTEET